MEQRRRQHHREDGRLSCKLHLEVGNNIDRIIMILRDARVELLLVKSMVFKDGKHGQERKNARFL